jgi:hypothetical protein
MHRFSRPFNRCTDRSYSRHPDRSLLLLPEPSISADALLAAVVPARYRHWQPEISRRRAAAVVRVSQR